jgi:hypothetical protein
LTNPATVASVLLCKTGWYSAMAESNVERAKHIFVLGLIADPEYEFEVYEKAKIS